tara:strand:- start:4 stop:414 length:411 start_codon:yes stop_codon:yes gene_type:complete
LSRINDKIDKIENYLNELKDIVPDKLEEYESNNLIKAACERYFEKIVEAITDIAFMTIAKKKFEIPEDDIDSFRILLKHKIIREDLYKRLKQAKGMRNILAHQYGTIDNKIVFHAITEELKKDTKEFIKAIKEKIK